MWSIGFEKAAASIGLTTTALSGLLIAVGAISASYFLWDYFVETFSEAAEAADEARQKYEQTQSEIQSIQDELQTTSDRIDELNAKDGLTLVEQDELARLQETNASLEQQLALKQQIAQTQAEASAAAARSALLNEGFKAYGDGGDVVEQKDGLGGFFQWITDAAGQSMAMAYSGQMASFDGGKTAELVKDSQSQNVNIIEATIQKQQQLNEKLKEQSQITDTSSDRYKELGDEIATLSGDISSYLSQIDQYRQSIVDAGLAESDAFKGVIEEIGHLEKFMAGYEAQDDSGNWVLTELGERAEQIEKVESFLSKPTLSKSFEQLKSALSENPDLDLYGIIAQFPELSSAAQAAGVNIVDVVNTIKSELGLLDFNEVRDQLKKALDPSNYDGLSDKQAELFHKRWSDWVDSLSDEELEIVYGIKQSNDTSAWTIEDWITAFENAKTSADNYSKTLSEVQEANAEAAEGISKVQNLLSGQSTGNSISLDDFNSEALKDYTSALEYNNGTLQLNAEKVREIVEAKTEEQIAINNTNKALTQEKYLENAAKIQEYRNQLQSMTDASDNERSAIQSNIDALLAENSALANECTQYDIMSQSLREATDAYHNFLNAKSASQAGDMFDDTLSALKMIDDVLNNEDSDMYGRVGRTDYKAALDFVIPDSVDSSDETAVNSYLNSISSLFEHDENGNAIGLDIEEFCEQAVDKGLMVFDEASDSYQIAGEKTMEEFADGMGLALPLVQAMFGEMQEFGGEFSWADEANRTMGDLAVSATESANSLRESLHELGYQDYEIQLDVSNFDTAEEKISTLENTISEMQTIRANFPVDSSEVQDALNVIRYCVAQKQALSAPLTMSVDTSAVSENVGNAIELVNEYQRTLNEIEYQKSVDVNADTTEAETRLGELQTEIAGLDPAIKATLQLDTTSVESLSASIAAITGDEGAQMLLKLGVNEDAIIGYEAPEKEATVVYDKDSSEPDNYQPDDKTAYVTFKKISYEVDSYSPQNLTRYVTYYRKTAGDVKVNGTAHVSGTAAASGNWGTASGGRTLVGELGREIIVDPHSGQWYTVGENGPEFVNVPRGSIVFNHKQTEDLLAHGYAIGRAAALASGTAMVTGGIKKKYTKRSTGGGSGGGASTGGSSGSGSSTSASTSTGTGSSTSTTTEETKEFEEELDWIEIAIDRIERKIKKLAAIAGSAFKKLSKRTSALNKEMEAVSEEITTQQQAYKRYMQAASSVDLSDSYKQLVRDGKIDLETITDEDLKEKIEKYQSYYEKALKAREEEKKLHEDLAQLYADNFDNIEQEYEHRLSLSEYLIDTYEEGIDQLETKGYLVSTKYYSAIQKVNKKNIDLLGKEVSDLETALAEGMASGEIEKYSPEWYEMQEAIQAAKKKLDEYNTSLAKTDKAMRELKWSYFDYAQERISKITEEADFLIDLMSNDKLFNDDGSITNQGLATAGLHAQNYDVYMAQADAYRKEMQKVTKQLAKDPNNTDIIARREELLELQQKSILAAEDEKKAIVSLVKDGIDLQLSSLKNLIDTYNDSLSSAKSLADYQKKIADQTKNISSIQKQLSAYEGDDSEENRLRVQQLRSNLESAQSDLESTQYDRYISDQRDLLDTLYTEYEENLNSRLDNVDAVMKDMINVLNANASQTDQGVSDAAAKIGLDISDVDKSISDTLKAEGKAVGYNIPEAIKSVWDGEKQVLSDYKTHFTEKITNIHTVLAGISAKVSEMVKASDKEAKDKVKETKKTTAPKKTTETTTKKTTKKKTTKKTSTPKKTGPTDAENYGVAIAIINGNYGWGTGETRKKNLEAKGFNYNTVQGIANQLWNGGYSAIVAAMDKYGIKDLSKYAYNKFFKGGLVDYTGPAWVDGSASDPEAFLDSKDTKNFMELRDTLRAMSTNYSVPIPSAVSSALSSIKSASAGNSNVSIGEVNIPIDIEHVEDVNELMAQIKRKMQGPEFAKFIQSISIDLINGGNSLAKSKYNIW